MTYQEALAEKEIRDSIFKEYCTKNNIKNIYWHKDPKNLEEEFKNNNVFTNNHIYFEGAKGFSLVELGENKFYWVPSGIMCCGDVTFLKQCPVEPSVFESNEWGVNSYVDCFGP